LGAIFPSAVAWQELRLRRGGGSYVLEAFTEPKTVVLTLG
jgi:hypothetical protein